MLWKPKKNSQTQRKIKILPIKNSETEPHLVLPSLFDKTIILPKISNPLHRLKDFLANKHALSLPTLNISNLGKSKGLSYRERRISGINDVIKTCEEEKYNKSLLLLFEINRSENELKKVVQILENFYKPDRPNPQKRRKENEFYITRIEMKKMIDELRSFTKHIAYS